MNASKWRLEPFITKEGTSVDIALIVAKRLHRGANRNGFANARSVRIIFEQMQGSASKRQRKELAEADESDEDLIHENHSTTLTLIDLIGDPIDPLESPLIKELMKMTGLKDVKDSVLAMAKMSALNYESELKGENVLDISLHRMFLGNPGTGKTTMATLYGKILSSMGLLSKGEVIVVGASKLTGGAMGSTAQIVNQQIDNCKGKVLVIDEAYVLANSTYGKEALDTLVERVQGSPGEDFAVILCGYSDEMKEMLRDCNPGLSRRFRSEDAFIFPDYNDEELTTILMERALRANLLITPHLAKCCVTNVLAKQRSKPHFGNVGAINNLLESGKDKMMCR